MWIIRTRSDSCYICSRRDCSLRRRKTTKDFGCKIIKGASRDNGLPCNTLTGQTFRPSHLDRRPSDRKSTRKVYRPLLVGQSSEPNLVTKSLKYHTLSVTPWTGLCLTVWGRVSKTKSPRSLPGFLCSRRRVRGSTATPTTGPSGETLDD